MKKVAVFGKPGSGKSTLSKQLSAATGIPLFQLDSIEYASNGERVARDIYDHQHQAILDQDSWLIDGFGPMASFQQRLAAADTLIYIDLPYPLSYWLVTKRMLKGLWTKPEGWPDGSSVIKGTLTSYKVLKMCPKFYNDAFLQRLTAMTPAKKLHVIRSLKQLNQFVDHVD